MVEIKKIFNVTRLHKTLKCRKKKGELRRQNIIN